ncbi:MAG: sigma-70 family RNA polymerase sigma factor [Pyrinomonadaceae bacterium]|nr:sigma-70 family RNA polymerase sigma factor [Acidobacteriota bacterium]MBK7934191.1 sigma-70 family RNA polymerase sigma factor [Acidobacteriota bacterium]MBP7376761.1 sigma-70 family RNA polymerase sigma factor [Pyrinomonadaceae bacterium]
MSLPQHEITYLLSKWSQGDSTAFDQLVPIVYPELRRIARRYMKKESSGHTLQTSALINEAYLRLVDDRSVRWQDRSHFFAVSSQIMRHILVDHARKHRSGKRGAGVMHVAFDEGTVGIQKKAEEFIALDAALSDLGKIDARKSRIVELRFFGGLTVDETAEALGLSPITIKREWRTARAWLLREIGNFDEK